LNVLPSPAPRTNGPGGGAEHEVTPVRRPRPTAPVGGMVRSPASTSSSGGGGSGGSGSVGMNLGPRLHIGVALGLALVMERDVSLATHPFLRSHILRDRPVLPLSIGLNWMAEAALRHSPEMLLHGCRNFRALRPIALDEAATDSPASHSGNGHGESDSHHTGLRLRLAAGAAQRKSNGLYEVPVELQSEQEQAYYRATMLLSQAPPPQAPVPLLPNLAARPYPRSVQEAMETLLFHGPDFQAIESIHGLGPRGISGSVRPSPDPTAWMTSPASQHWHADPLLLEGSVQLLMLWSIENLQAPCLPSRYGAVRVYRPPQEQAAYATEIMIRAYDRTHIACDVYFSDSTGRPIMTVEDMDCSVDRGYAAAFGKG
ncbi:MAG TPA: polyketide synthase dehydratase domain-containing protein, partial [Candidatus Methylacidiphilales bacterium]|nr:polyketide synthase dehydratase domain-containing protein [Candidatus Methylacidiphilales bacterium]